MEQLEFEVATFSVNETRRTMTGVVVPWNGIGKKNDGRRWRFAKGSLKYGAVKYIRLLEDHSYALQFGRAVSAEETDEGLVMTFKVSLGAHGDRMLAMAQEGSKTGLSVGVEFEEADTENDPDNPGARLINMANFFEVSLVKDPAFADSRLISVTASASSTDGRNTGMPDTDIAPAETPVYTFSSEQFAQLLDRMGNPQAGPTGAPQRQVVNPMGSSAIQVNEPLPYSFSRGTGFRRGPQGYDFSSDIIRAGKNDEEAKGRVEAFLTQVFDTDRADVAALNPNINRPDMYVPELDYVTPLWDMVNRGTLADSTPFIVPKKATATGLVGAHTEGVEPTAGTITKTTQTITPTAVSGKVEITREAWDQGGNPQLSTLIWQDMLREYYEDREAAVATFLNTLTAATDIAITAGGGTDGQTAAAELEAAIAALQFVRGGNRFAAFAVHVDLYKVLAAAKDDNGRPLYPQISPSNANGTAQALFRFMDIAGTRAVPSWALGATGVVSANSWLFDPTRVHGWASAPRRLQFEYQVKSIEVGIWGYIATANTDIAGVRQVTYDPVP
jgi:HK97 family phage prohead protease